MLREIAAARENNVASHQLSNSSLTVRQLPGPIQMLSRMDEAKTTDTDRRVVGADTTGPSSLDTYQINLQA